MKVLGQDLIDFWKEWPPGPDVYVDDAEFGESVKGILCLEQGDGAAVDPTKKYGLSGYLGWQGKGDEPADFDDDLESVFKKWLKKKTTTTLVIEVPNEAVENLKAMITNMLGGKVV